MSPSDNKNLIGIDTKIEKIISLLNIGTNDAHRLGIWGIGGIGKTTLAEAVFNKISLHFEVSHFIHNVREEIEKGGLNRLREKLLLGVLGDGNMNIGAFIAGHTFTINRLGRKNILIIFDDVSDFGQIESLIGNLNYLSPQSRIIITTRDKQVLRNCGVDQLYEVQKLFHDEALELFCRYAFNGNNPTKDYIELSEQVARYAEGLPLALKILGSSLFGKSKEVWDDTIGKLEKIIDRNIHKVLKISYDELEDEVQQIFLDIAIFFNRSDVGVVRQVLKACGFSYQKLAISILNDKSLIAISNNMIIMHDLLQTMAKEIVRQECVKYPGKRSRLWDHEDIYSVLTNNTGTEKIEGISLDVSKVKTIKLNPLAFSMMQKLRVLNFYSSYWEKSRVHVVNDLESDFTELRYLHWHEYPLTSLSSKFCLQNLTVLKMRESNLIQLWDGVQVLPNLKMMDFSFSGHLTCIPDLSQAPNLESLVLRGCTNLTEIPSSIQHLVKLVNLDLQWCANLWKFPASSDSIKRLDLYGCLKLKAFPIASSMEMLLLFGTAVEVLPSNFGRLSRLRSLDLGSCSRLTCLPDSICRLTSLEQLNISGCSKLDGLPEELGNLENLQRLEADGVPVKKIPSSMSRLKNLSILAIGRPKCQEQPSLQLPPLLEFHRLNDLHLDNCGITELPESLGLLSSVTNISLAGNNLESIPESIIHLSGLRYLNISYCERLQSLPELPRSLHILDAANCKSLQALSNLPTLPAKLSLNFVELTFFNCFNLNRNEIRNIVKNVLLKILSKEYARGPCVSIKFPGDEIPEWFIYQRLGSFILFKLPPDWFNDAFFGFALCIVVPVCDHIDNHGGLWARFECKVKSPDGESFLLNNDDPLRTRYSFGAWDFLVGADHVLLNLFEVQRGDFCGKYFSDEISFQFYLKDYHDIKKPINCCKVKKCGVRLMYKQDFVDSGESFNFDDNCFWKSTEESSTSRRFRFEEEEQKEPDPKRLKPIEFF